MADPSERGLTYERCRDLLERFRVLLEEALGAELVALALFGSVARGEGGPTSDLDLLVVHRGHPEAMLDGFARVLQRLRGSAEYLRLQAEGFLADPAPVFFTADQLATRPWLLLDILDHGIVLFDHDGTLQAELDRMRGRLRALGARKVVLPDGTWYWDLKPDWKPGEVIEL
jgi:predicted nucleotidyltransferase